jgi:putative transposase
MRRPRSETLQPLDFQDGIYIQTDEGCLYLAAVIDLFSRQVVGWRR